MNTKRIPMLRVSTTCFAIVLAALIIARLIGALHPVRAQNSVTEKVLYNFAPATGYGPGGLTADVAGNIYAATTNGGSDQNCSMGCGSILKLSTPSGQPTTLYTFMYSGFGKAGPFPAGLTRDAKGNLYAATSYGGRNHYPGSIIKVTPSGAAGTLYSFQAGQDGYNPSSAVTIDSDGNLYGTTVYGGGTGCGGQGCGVIYKVTRPTAETVLYSFTGGADGRSPGSSPVMDSAGNLYGTTTLGGDLNCPLFAGVGCGAVWKLDTSNNLTILYTFTGASDGAGPEAGLVMDTSGNLYGAAFAGGDLTCDEGFGCGVAFKIDSAGNFSLLHTFVGGPGDGASPTAATLVLDPNGNLYGTTGSGGDQSCNLGCGVVFKLDASGNETILHAFTGGVTDGVNPMGGLITDGRGNLYGTTYAGGIANVGVIFKVQMQ